MSKSKEDFMALREQELSIQETALSFELNSLMESNKAHRTTLAQTVVQDVRDGLLDPTQVFIYANKGQEFFKSVIDNVRPIVASKQIQKGGIKSYNSEIIEKKNPDSYDFSVCGDFEWDSLNAQLAEIKEKIKDRETFLKTLKEPMATMDGEVINPPAITYGALNVAIKLL